MWWHDSCFVFKPPSFDTYIGIAKRRVLRLSHKKLSKLKAYTPREGVIDVFNNGPVEGNTCGNATLL